MNFSVLICVYKNDSAEHFRLALESVINQTLKPDEVVLVVDGPVPESIDSIIKSFEKNPYFKVLRLKENVGLGNAKKIGIEHCSNELIAFMDADDISLPDRFEKQIKCFEQNEALSVVGGNIAEFVGHTGNIVGIRRVPENDSDIKTYMKKRCPFNHVTVMIKRADVLNAGGYKDWYCNEDYYLWLRMFEKGAVFRNLNDILVLVRVGPEMYRRRGGLKYFLSEAKLQKYMLNRRIIGFSEYALNMLVRFIVQILMPNKLRGYVFQKFARTKV